jgi:hypothetical protein
MRRGVARDFLALTLCSDTSSGFGTLIGTITDSTGLKSTIQADRALFTAAKNPTPPQQHVSPSFLGVYNLIVAPTGSSKSIPRGSGWGRVIVAPNGSVRMTAILADGSAIAAGSALSLDGSWPIYVPLGGRGSALSGRGSLASGDLSDIAGALIWFKNANPSRGRYPAGWPSGITVNLSGCRYASSKTLFGALARGAETTAPSSAELGTTLTLRGGGLPTDEVVHANVRSDLFQLGAAELENLRFTMNKSTGLLAGTFRHPASGKLTSLRGIYLQRQGLAAGFFLGSAESGEVLLTRD